MGLRLKLDKNALIPLLEELSRLLELKGESPFKSQAYANAARVLKHFQDDLADAIESRALLEEKGIGKSTFAKIYEWATSGRSSYYEEVKAAVPPGLLEMSRIRGLGTKKIRTLHESLGIETLVDLEYACIENRLLHLPGFGKKTQEKIQNGIAFHKKHQGYVHAHIARQIAEALLSQIHRVKGVKRASTVGALRRRNEVVKQIALIASSGAPETLKTAFQTFEGIAATQCQLTAQSGFDTLNGLTSEGIAVQLHIVPDDCYALLLHHFTGNTAYHAAFAAHAKHCGIKVSRYGLFLDDHPLPCPDEETLFSTLDLAPIPPELREGKNEIAEAAKHALPTLVRKQDIRGIFHVHSTYSDGAGSLSEMVEAASAAGYEYIGISDHSQSAFYANGLKPERIKKQHEEIDTLQQQFENILILKGIESDILPDGRLDYGDDILFSFDFVIASVHSHFNLSEKEMTHRIIRAMSHPAVTILGHPTGRLLLSREAYAVNMPDVIQAAAEYSVAIELNASPYRLDLDWRYCQFAKAAGVRLSLNPDAHKIESMTDLDVGIGIARKGWLSAHDLINTLPKAKIINYLKNSDHRKNQTLKSR